MKKNFDSLNDNDIEIIVIAYLLKHPDLIDIHFESLDDNLFAASAPIPVPAAVKTATL